MDSERIALSKIAYERGITLDRLNVMFSKANEYIYLIPQNQIDREKQLDEMIELALVDGDFARAELDLILMVGQKLGFEKPELLKHIKSRCGDHNHVVAEAETEAG